MGAICEACGKDMLPAEGCGIDVVHAGGKLYNRIKVGETGDFDGGVTGNARCHDCNALIGHLHHWGCDAERCPACGCQLISCDCENVFICG